MAARLDHSTITVTRLFDAPRDLVFRAWTDPEQLARWCDQALPTLLEAVAPERLVFIECAGNLTATIHTVTFEEHAGGTRLHVMTSQTHAAR